MFLEQVRLRSLATRHVRPDVALSRLSLGKELVFRKAWQTSIELIMTALALRRPSGPINQDKAGQWVHSFAESYN